MNLFSFRTDPIFVKASQDGRLGLADEDLRLAERVLGGDRQAFEVLVDNQERRVFRVTLAVLGASRRC